MIFSYVASFRFLGKTSSRFVPYFMSADSDQSSKMCSCASFLLSFDDL